MTATRRRRGLFVWGAIAVVVVVAALAISAITERMSWSQAQSFDPESVAPGGTRALARILAEQGVEVEVVRDRAAAEAALADGPATLVLTENTALDDEDLTGLADAAGDVVVPNAGARAARVLLGAAATGFGGADPVAADCALPAARRAGAILPGQLFEIPAGVTACYPDGDGAALLSSTADGRTITVIDGSELFTNTRLADDGNAALALNLMGASERLVWYVPSASEAAGEATLGSATPPWVTPAIVLLALATVAAGSWRGRRFGPLVAERMPVSVTATETDEGRGRLYARSRDRAHAAEQLRRGTARTLARRLRLGAAASPADVAAAATALLGPASRGDEILAGPAPQNDADLVQLAIDLDDLDAAVAAAQHLGKGSS